MIIAIDGPAGAGKSTAARILAKKLGFLYIDTGAMYRALTLKALQHKVGIKDTGRLINLARQSRIGLKNNPDGSIKISLDGKDISKAIRKPRITRFVSDIAKIRDIRKVMLKLQRNLGRQGNVVLDGRDIGTVVFPKAEKKFYVDARFSERVKRRHKELKGLKQGISLEEVRKDLRNRDKIDSTRKVAPLKKARDAIYIDTTDMSITEMADNILKRVLSS